MANQIWKIKMKHKLPDPILAPLFFIDSDWDKLVSYQLKFDTSSRKDLLKVRPYFVEVIRLNKKDLLPKQVGRYLK